MLAIFKISSTTLIRTSLSSTSANLVLVVGRVYFPAFLWSYVNTKVL